VCVCVVHYFASVLCTFVVSFVYGKIKQEDCRKLLTVTAVILQTLIDSSESDDKELDYIIERNINPKRNVLRLKNYVKEF